MTKLIQVTPKLATSPMQLGRSKISISQFQFRMQSHIQDWQIQGHLEWWTLSGTKAKFQINFINKDNPVFASPEGGIMHSQA